MIVLETSLGLLTLFLSVATVAFGFHSVTMYLRIAAEHNRPDLKGLNDLFRRWKRLSETPVRNSSEPLAAPRLLRPRDPAPLAEREEQGPFPVRTTISKSPGLILHWHQADVEAFVPDMYGARHAFSGARNSAPTNSLDEYVHGIAEAALEDGSRLYLVVNGHKCDLVLRQGDAKWTGFSQIRNIVPDLSLGGHNSEITRAVRSVLEHALMTPRR